MRYEIKPFKGVENLSFGAARDLINSSILKGVKFDAVENTNVSTGMKSTNDFFENGLALGYLNTEFLLKYIILTPPCEAIFENRDLLAMNYQECLDFMKKHDENIEEEEYVGFTSHKYGIAIYAPDATDDRECSIESVTVGKQGYFKQK
jgi:hypothetical protein